MAKQLRQTKFSFDMDVDTDDTLKKATAGK